MAVSGVVGITTLGTKIGALVRMLKGHPEVVCAVDTDRPVIALTIDDRPDAKTFPTILKVPARYRL